MRRLLISCVCLLAAAYAVWLVVARNRPDAWQVAPPVDLSPPSVAPLADVVPLQPSEAAPRPAPVRDSERRLLELVGLRHEIATRVDRRALYAMAHDRGVPHHALFSKGSEALLEAILDREQMPPADVLPSEETLGRMAAIAEEAFARHDRLLDGDEALDAG